MTVTDKVVTSCDEILYGTVVRTRFGIKPGMHRKNEKKSKVCMKTSWKTFQFFNFYFFFRAARNSPFMGPKSGIITGGL